MLKLRPVHTNFLPKKKSYKGSLVSPSGPNSLKIIYVLLAEVVNRY